MSCSHTLKCIVNNCELKRTCWSGVMGPQRPVFMKCDKFDQFYDGITTLEAAKTKSQHILLGSSPKWLACGLEL
jgi:hypothetical protein